MVSVLASSAVDRGLSHGRHNNFSAISRQEQGNVQWYDDAEDEVRFVLDQHT
jgi:hypothetical protein